MIDLSGKVALITGGSRGIGRAAVRLFSEAGASVAFTYTKAKSEAESLVTEIQNKGRDIFAFQAEFTDAKSVEMIIPAVLDRYKTLDILVNNAGIWTYGKIDEMSDEVWDETVTVNLKAIFLLCRSAARLMKKNKSGRIINISSTAGQRGEAEHSHYAASKGAIISLTKSLASELGPYGIRTNCVAPGWVVTDMSREIVTNSYSSDEILKTIPLGYIPGPEEIAGPILFLASDLANHINGEILNVNGGSILCG
jgi:3-oxoacyl-[acyl-carrier protein] reductase